MPHDLHGLLGMEAELFLREWWQRHPCAHSASEDRVFGLMRDDVEALISGLDPSSPARLSVIEDHRAVPMSGEGPRLTVARAAYDRGGSLLVTRVDCVSSAVGAICRELQCSLAQEGVVLAAGVNANAYLTPPHAQAFAPHYDDHDAFVLQAEGTKRWTVYGALEAFPLARQSAAIDRERLPAMRLQATLRAGDALYVPRGFYHEAETDDDPSLHLTLSVRPVTWADVLSRAAAHCPSVREVLPLHGLADGEAFRTALRGKLRDVADAIGAHEAARESLQSALDELTPEDETAVSGLDADAVVTHRHGARPRIVATTDGIRLMAGSGGLEGPAALDPVFRFVCATPTFTARNLPPVLSAQSAVDLVAELIRVGVLRRVHREGRRTPAT